MDFVWIISGTGAVVLWLWIVSWAILDCASTGPGNRRPIAAAPKAPPPPKPKR
jgi:hypothetical protein